MKKSFAMIFVSLAGSLASAATIRSAACDQQLMNTTADKAKAVQIKAVVEILNERGQLNLSQDVKIKLMVKFNQQVRQFGAQRLEAFGKTAYFACTNEMTAEDRATMARSVRAVLSM